VPMASLWQTEGGFRAVRRQDTSPVLHVDGGMSLDRVYLRLDRVATTFAVVNRKDGTPGVLDANHLRHRVMGTARDAVN
jgi:hypothetical protein